MRSLNSKILVMFLLMLSGCANATLFTQALPFLNDYSSASGDDKSERLPAAESALASSPCQYETIKKGKSDTASILKSSLNVACPGLMNTILKNEKESDVFDATDDFMKTAGPYIVLAAKESDGPKNEEQLELYKQKVEPVNTLGQFIADKCKQKNVKACDAAKSYQHEVGVISPELEEVDKDESKKSIQLLVDKACACDKFITLNQSDINRQKEVGRVSGTMNMVVLNNAGNHIVDIKKIKKEIATSYKSLTKKELKNYKCSNVETLADPIMWSRGVGDVRFEE